ncbi:TPA: 4-oxalocrotonate tautomerase family protein [Yersinia enterocolitica]|uniref:tautomerase family protein n=1 Tax=Yersinia enterocolitica TaxID=630 RepID=UPI00094B94D4|nr:tautomerase family protein [Yersinia enterocolitica]HEN3564840.1 tautomerase family protein [Yersinia enterocolitica]HEN3568981.1 tautomerase family protein [Yersinia enterocolitica]HEN3574196.1 tautomerase family protein [Yersinia enterocolitica]HEN3604160.1 tautomerase family protein [Yersinia enterocolitica]HEN3613160.1 tautomerase family protein [Yersinia enterocolitica]
MPHVIVKIVGQSEESKQRIAEKLTQALTDTLGIDEQFVSISIEDIIKENWVEDVYNPDIMEKSHSLYKKPGYDPL